MNQRCVYTRQLTKEPTLSSVFRHFVASRVLPVPLSSVRMSQCLSPSSGGSDLLQSVQPFNFHLLCRFCKLKG